MNGFTGNSEAFVEGPDIERLVEGALLEDGAGDDCTTRLLGIEARPAIARLYARAEGVLAGIDVARLAFMKRDPSVRFEKLVADGARIGPDQVLAQLSGRAGSILAAERVALNFLQRLSGIATLAARFAEKLAGTGVRLLDTRKTTPLMRRLERYAVAVGGGSNHRFNLSDMVLVKDNHLRLLGGPEPLKRALAGRPPHPRVEVEVDSLELLRSLLGEPIDQLMLDNFTPGQVGQAVREIEAYRAGHPMFTPAIEVSGGITLDNVADYAAAGVHYVSVGAVTHSAPALNMSLEVVPDGV